jgi:hypothetical protein
MTWQSAILLVLFPPVAVIIWLFLSRGWATTMQRGHVSDQTRKRQKVLFWCLLGAAYVVEVAGVLSRHSR